jgi:hypothetical protein
MRLPIVALLGLCLIACLGAHGPSDQGITSPIHRAHVGGMVFSNAVIAHGKENAGALVEHCVLGEPCYGRFYLKSSLRDGSGFKYIAAFALHATVDGRALPDGLFQMEGWWSTYNFTLFRAEGDTAPWEHPKWFLDRVARQLAPGEHVLELAVLAIPPGTAAGAGKPLAIGRIGLTVPADSAGMIASALARENQILAAAHQQAAAQESARQAAFDAEEARPAQLTLENDCDRTITFLFVGCGGDKQFATVGSGQKQPLTLHFNMGVNCDVCVAKGSECNEMSPSMVTKDTKEVRVSSMSSCDSPQTY